MNPSRTGIKDTDFSFLIICGICSAISVLSMYSIYRHMNMMTTVRPVIVQLVASLIGLVAAFLISFIDYRELCEHWQLHSGIAYALMLLTAIFGYAPPGTTNKAWIQLPFGMSLQTSEILKISTVLLMAMVFEKYKNNLNEIRTLVKVVGIALIPLAAVAFQKDGGTLLVFLIMIACMFFAAGISWKVVALGFAALIVGSPLIWFVILEDYQKNRILGLFHPEQFTRTMWQQINGRISIGSGRIIGKGFFVDTHNNTPLAYNDFIFSFIAESIGFVGTVLLLILIFFLWFKMIQLRRRSDIQGSIICVGIFSMLMAQTFINVGMNLMLLPVIGVTLPLFTAGGTSVVVVYAAVGLVMSVARQNPKTLFD